MTMHNVKHEWVEFGEEVDKFGSTQRCFMPQDGIRFVLSSHPFWRLKEDHKQKLQLGYSLRPFSVQLGLPKRQTNWGIRNRERSKLMQIRRWQGHRNEKECSWGRINWRTEIERTDENRTRAIPIEVKRQVGNVG